jgi:hypothetical protein
MDDEAIEMVRLVNALLARSSNVEAGRVEAALVLAAAPSERRWVRRCFHAARAKRARN